MGCQCQENWYRTTESVPLRLELGPAYADYQAGRVEISSSWEQNANLIPAWMDQCCAEMPPDWTNADEWKEHTAMLVCFYVYSTALLGAFIWLRDQQPFRFRDVKAAALLWAVQIFNITAGVVNGNMGGTASTIPSMLFSYCGGPLTLYYYIMKGVQVYYVHAWNEAKLHRRSLATLKKFLRFSFILKFRFYLLGFLAVFVLCAIPMVYAVAVRDAYAGALKYNQYNSLRCEWWNIPEPYTIPTSSSQLCSCLTQLPSGDESRCAWAIQSSCFSMGEKDPAEAGFCEACLPEIASRVVTNTCREWFEAFYASGSCGMPSRVPRTSTCAVGVFADREMGYVPSGISFAFMLLNAIVILPLLFKRDDFGIIHENIACSVVVLPSLLFCYSPLLPNNGGLLDWYFDDLKITYRPIFLFLWLGIWGSTTITFGYPLFLFLYSKVTAGSEATGDPQPGDPGSLHGAHRGPQSVSSQSNGRSMAPWQTMFVHRTPRNAEQEVERCVRNATLLTIYRQFAAEAYHIEIANFLEDCTHFLDRARERGSATDIQTLQATGSQAQVLFETYLMRNGVMEVNISGRVKRAVQAEVDRFVQLTEASTTDSEVKETGTETQAEVKSADESQSLDEGLRGALRAMLQAIADAYDEARALMANDCWPRFRQSRYFAHYRSVLEGERHVSEVVDRVTGQQTHSMFDFNVDDGDDDNNGDGLPQLQMAVIRETSHLGTSSSVDAV